MASNRVTKSKIARKIEALPQSTGVREFLLGIFNYESQKSSDRAWFKKPYDEMLQQALKIKGGVK